MGLPNEDEVEKLVGKDFVKFVKFIRSCKSYQVRTDVWDKFGETLLKFGKENDLLAGQLVNLINIFLMSFLIFLVERDKKKGGENSGLSDIF